MSRKTIHHEQFFMCVVLSHISCKYLSSVFEMMDNHVVVLLTWKWVCVAVCLQSGFWCTWTKHEAYSARIPSTLSITGSAVCPSECGFQHGAACFHVISKQHVQQRESVCAQALHFLMALGGSGQGHERQARAHSRCVRSDWTLYWRRFMIYLL